MTAVTRSGLNLIEITYAATDLYDTAPAASTMAGVDIEKGAVLPIQDTTAQVTLASVSLIAHATATSAGANVAQSEAVSSIIDCPKPRSSHPAVRFSLSLLACVMQEGATPLMIGATAATCRCSVFPDFRGNE